MARTYSVVVPCYNEAANIPLLVGRFAQSLNRSDIELVLVNNGSTDDSTTVLVDAMARHGFVRVVNVDVNQGYGYGILAGLAAATGDFLGWTHADLQADPADVVKAVEIAEQAGTDRVYVKGLRRGRPLFDRLFTWGMSAFETAYLRRPLWDINAQPNLFPRSFYESWESPPHDFSLDLFALYMARSKGLQVVRFDVLFPKRLNGQSHWNTGLPAKWRFIKRTIDFSVRLKNGLHP